MKVMVIGGGGREHAIIKKLKESKDITELYALPGNGGIARGRGLRKYRRYRYSGAGEICHRK